MNLVEDYDSDSDSDETEQLPQIPSEVLDKFHKAPLLPLDFNMRYTRVFTPPAGYFNSYCSLEFLPNRSQIRSLDSVFQNFMLCTKMSPLLRKIPQVTPLYTKNGVTTQVHVSLTGNTFLSKDAKSLFHDELRSSLARFSYRKDVNLVMFDKVKLLWNSDYTRLFLTLSLSKQSGTAVHKIRKSIEESLEKATEELITAGPELNFNVDTYHVTIGEIEDAVHIEGVNNDDDLLERFNAELDHLEAEDELAFSYDSVKVNNGVSRLSLKIGDYVL